MCSAMIKSLLLLAITLEFSQTVQSLACRARVGGVDVDVDWWMIHRMGNQDNKAVGWWQAIRHDGETTIEAVATQNDAPANWDFHSAAANDPLWLTVRMQLKDQVNDNLRWLHYSEYKCDKNCAHAKGTLAEKLDDNTGFWVTHSVPAFPTSGWAYPKTGFGQHFFCISLVGNDTIKLVSKHLDFRRVASRRTNSRKSPGAVSSLGGNPRTWGPRTFEVKARPAARGYQGARDYSLFRPGWPGPFDDGTAPDSDFFDGDVEKPRARSVIRGRNDFEFTVISKRHGVVSDIWLDVVLPELLQDGDAEWWSVKTWPQNEVVQNGKKCCVQPPDACRIPEGVATRPGTDEFFVTSTTDGTVFRGQLGRERTSVFPPSAPATAARTRSASAPRATGSWSPVVSRAAVFVYDLRTRRLVRRFSTGTGGLINDVAITPSGDVYVTDSPRSRLFRIPARDLVRRSARVTRLRLSCASPRASPRAAIPTASRPRAGAT